MVGRIDAFLAANAPPWYRTPRTQAATLGVVFFWVFAAYTTIQFYAASTYGSELAADSVSAVYLTFTVTCLVAAPGITNKWGCRATMLVGVLGYASLVLASLIYFLYGGEGAAWARRTVVMGGAVLGCGAALLWTAQGRLILQYACRAEALAGGASKGAQAGTQTGTLMGLFWAIFQCSSLVGGAISFLYYNQKPQGSTALYCVFLAFILMGGLFTQFLLPPSMLGTGSSRLDTPTEHTPLNTNLDPKPVPQNPGIADDLSQHSWWHEARASLQVFFTKRMLCLSLLFFYTGFNQPYQQATFGNRFFTRRTIGAELIIFHLMEIVGAIVCGRFLDSDTEKAVGRTSFLHNSNNRRRKRAIACLVAFVLINSTGNLLAWAQENAAKYKTSESLAHDISEISAISPSLAFACWGFADAQIQVYCYWLIGGFYTSGSDHSRAVGFYKCVQSLGTSIGFYFIPTARLSEISQLGLSSLIFLVGTGLSFLQLPS